VTDTGEPRGTGERGHGVRSVVFIQKATLIMVSSVLFLRILGLDFDVNKISIWI